MGEFDPQELGKGQHFRFDLRERIHPQSSIGSANLSRRPAASRQVVRLPSYAQARPAAHGRLPARVPDAAAPTPRIPGWTALRDAARGAAARVVPGAAGSARAGAILRATG